MTPFTTMKSLLLSSLAAMAAATDLLLPLYNYPGTNGADWASVRSALAAHPSVQAKIVLNVDSGPGSGAPNSDWIAGGQALSSLSNVALVGYVPVNRTARELADAEADVSAWAAWLATYGINVSGIFVDEAPNTGDSATVDYSKQITGAVLYPFMACS